MFTYFACDVLSLTCGENKKYASGRHASAITCNFDDKEARGIGMARSRIFGLAELVLEMKLV